MSLVTTAMRARDPSTYDAPMPIEPAPSAATVRSGLAEWFRRPPRPHGEAILHRSVSYLELFYDLVFVVCIARAAHSLAEDVSWSGIGRFSVVFGLIWIAWMNGTLYHELHGREDGRTRSFVFLQMILLTVLAAFTSHAADRDGGPFAITLAILLVVLAWLWYQVQRADHGAYRDTSGRYLVAMAVLIAGMAGSVPLADDARIVVWGALGLAWMTYVARLFMKADAESIGVTITHSMVERFALLVIIVLGEVVVGVVGGMEESGRDALALTTGGLGLIVGFGLWWNYFDTAGARMPRSRRGGFTLWVFGHVPLTAAVAAGGAAMVSLVEHAHDSRTPTATSWLMAGSVAVMLVSLAALMRSLLDWDAHRALSVAETRSLFVATAMTLLIGWTRPAPWLLSSLLAVVLAATWFVAFRQRIVLGYGPAPVAPVVISDSAVE